MKRKTIVTKEYDKEGNLIKETTETIEEDGVGLIYPLYPIYPAYPPYSFGTYVATGTTSEKPDSFSRTTSGVNHSESWGVGVAKTSSLESTSHGGQYDGCISVSHGLCSSGQGHTIAGQCD